MDLNTMRLPDWVNNVRDLATGLVMLPPTFLVTGKVIQSSVLPKLERVAGVKSCRFCLHPHTVCGCSQISAWSHTSTRQTPATATTARSHDSTSVSASMRPPPGLLSHGAAAPTSTYSEALVLTPPPCMRGVSQLPLPRAGYPSVGLCPGGPQPQNGGPNQAGAPSVLSKGAKNSLSTASASPSSCHPFLRGWERSHPRNDKEITGAGVPDHYHRLWSRALHQESGSPFPRPKRLQDRTLRVRPREGAGLISERDLRRDGASQLLKAEHSPLSVEPPLLPQFSWVAFTLGTQHILEERDGKRMPTGHTCITSP